MSKITRTKILRKLNNNQPAIERFKIACRGCGRAMFVSIGQIARFHKACRQERNSWYRRRKKLS